MFDIEENCAILASGDRNKKDTKMTEQEIFDQIRPIVAEKSWGDLSIVMMDSLLTSDLDIDLWDSVQMCTAIERYFGISFLPDGNKNDLHEENAYIVEHIQTVGDLVRLIKSKQDEKGPSAMVLFFMTRGGKKLPRKTPRKPVAKFVMPQKPMMLNPSKKR